MGKKDRERYEKIEWPKNITSDLITALSPFGIDNFLVLGLQDVPGSDEQRVVWSLSAKDRKAFAMGLTKILADPEGPGKLLKMIFGAHDILRRLAAVKAKIQREQGKA